MASALNAAAGAAAALLFWGLIGIAVGRRVLPDRGLALPFAPALGWAVANAAGFPLLLVLGFTPAALAVTALLAGTAAAIGCAAPRHSPEPVRVPPIAYLGAAALALAPAAAVLPKIGEHGASLAAPIFDHSKVAIIDAMVRLGLPPVNPAFGEVGGSSDLAYYPLWHFSAATIALGTGITGWEADAALTWFTAFASLTLGMGLAIRLGGRAAAAYWVLLLAPVGSLRPVIELLLGRDALDLLLQPASGLGGWLFQGSWSPQHLQSASSAVLALLLLSGLPRRAAPLQPLALALVLAAAFQSSLWIGGIVLPLAAAIAGLALLASAGRRDALRFALKAAAAALMALALSMPLLIAQYEASLLREVTAPVRIAPHAVLGPLFPAEHRPFLDAVAFWLVFLILEFPAVFPLGAAVLARRLGTGEAAAERPGILICLTTLAATSLAASWLLVSTVGENNDLGWRAVLPGLLILIAAAAAGLARGSNGLRRVGPLALLALGLPHGIDIIRHNFAGIDRPQADGAFLQSPALWTAVRRHAGADDRVANNPLHLREMTLWPVNVSWALLADRSSCFAGRELALALAPLPADRRQTLEEQFIRVFAGRPAPGDLDDLAQRYDCRVVAVTAGDGAWREDPFAESPFYRLAETAEGRWRIYVRAPPGD